MIIGKIFTFDAAHRLPNHKGHCQNQHGHTWTLTVEISAPVNKKTGMVMDYGNLKEIVNKLVIDNLDHQNLNNTFNNPTCENIIQSIANTLKIALKPPVKLHSLKLQEGNGGYAIWITKD